MAVRSGRKRKKTWSMWEEKRIPSEYEAVTYKFHSHFRREPVPFEMAEDWAINKFYIENRESSKFNVDDWEGYRDPRAYTYRRYIEDQREREVYCDNLIDEYEARNHYQSLDKRWLDFLGESYLPVRFPGHAMQMSAAYIGQMAPAAFITNTFYWQLGNEMRRIQRQAYLAQVLAMDNDRPDLAMSDRTRNTWTGARNWQGLRELIEKQLCAYDWGEAFASRNLVVRPIFDHIFNSELARIAEKNGDMLLSLMHSDFRQHDEAYAVDNTKALVAYATGKKPELAGLLNEWIAKWAPLGEAAAKGLAKGMASAPNSESSDVIYQRTMDATVKLAADCGLNWPTAAQKKKNWLGF